MYHKWKAAWWLERSSLQNHGDASLLHGISGYAHKQAAISTCMAEQCALYWLPHLLGKGIRPVWATEYEHLLWKDTVLHDGVAVDRHLDETFIDLEDEEGENTGLEVDNEINVDEAEYFDFG